MILNAVLPGIIGGMSGGTTPGKIGGGKGILIAGLNNGLKGNGGVLPAIFMTKTIQKNSNFFKIFFL